MIYSFNIKLIPKSTESFTVITELLRKQYIH